MLDHVSAVLGHQHKVTSSAAGLTRTADIDAAVQADLEAAGWTTAEIVRKMTRSAFSDRILRTFIDHPDYRLGQAAFNAALNLWPEDVRQLTGTEADPFYIDQRVGAFLDALFPPDGAECPA